MYNIIHVHNCTHVFMHINTPYMVILVERLHLIIKVITCFIAITVFKGHKNVLVWQQIKSALPELITEWAIRLDLTLRQI